MQGLGILNVFGGSGNSYWSSWGFGIYFFGGSVFVFNIFYSFCKVCLESRFGYCVYVCYCYFGCNFGVYFLSCGIWNFFGGFCVC